MKMQVMIALKLYKKILADLVHALGNFYLQNCLAGCFGLNGVLRQYFSLYRAVSQLNEER